MAVNPIIAEFDNNIKIKEYAQAYQIYDLRRGRSSGREWKSSVFFFLAVAMLFMLSLDNFNIVKNPVTAIVLMISMYMCTHYVYLLPKKAKLQGEHIYKSSRLLSKKYRFIIKRDYFEINNDYEFLKRYYTEIIDCIETNDTFILIGGMEHIVTVISKRCLTDEQIETISVFFKSEMIRVYRRSTYGSHLKKK